MFLADTNFVIDLLRKKYDLSTIKENSKGENMAISLITLSELFTGLYYTKSKLGERIYQKKEEELKTVLLAFDILNLNLQIMESAGAMRGILLSKEKSIDLVDLIIGATAQHYNATAIISRNIDHFSCWDLPLKNY